MPNRVFLHVGLPKSGTTFVQSVLAENKQHLMDDSGLLYPGETWLDQLRAVRDVREIGHTNPKEHVVGAWQRLVAEIQAWDGDSIVSMEWLGSAQRKQIRRIVRDLWPAAVEVVFTARDLGRTIPAAWQEAVQNRHDCTWTTFVDGVAADEARAPALGRQFWAHQDLAQLLDTWGRAVRAERIHVVTVPPAGAGVQVLWDRFAAALGIDGSRCVVDGVSANESLGVESAELVRRFNTVSHEREMPKPLYGRAVKHGMSKAGLAKRKTVESRLTLPRERHDWVLRRAEQQASAIRAAGVNVVGDLDDLRPTLDMDGSRQPDELDDASLLEVATQALAILVEQGAEERQRLREEYFELLQRRDEEHQRVWKENLELLQQREDTLTQLSDHSADLEQRNAELTARLGHWESRPLRGAARLYSTRHPRLRPAVTMLRLPARLLAAWR